MRRRFVRTGALACDACCAHRFRARLIRKRTARGCPPMDRTPGQPTRGHSPFPSGRRTHVPGLRNGIGDVPDDPCTELIDRIYLTISSRPVLQNRPHFTSHRFPLDSDAFDEREICITLVPIIISLPSSQIMGIASFNVTLVSHAPGSDFDVRPVRSGSFERTDSIRAGASVQASGQTNLFPGGKILFRSGRHLHSYTACAKRDFMKTVFRPPTRK
jgi:hypothetical protein